MKTIYILVVRFNTHEPEKICGATDNPDWVKLWVAAAPEYNRWYELPLNQIPKSVGYNSYPL